MLKHGILAATASFALVSGAAFAAAPAAPATAPTAAAPATANGQAKKMMKHDKKGGEQQAPATEQKK